MTDRERRINEALKHLGEEFRRGLLDQQEYRVRRRRLVDSWSEHDVTTSPGTRNGATITEPALGAPAPSGAPGRNRRWLVAVLVALAVLILLAVGLGWTVSGRA
jgi:hypothetical protein